MSQFRTGINAKADKALAELAEWNRKQDSKKAEKRAKKEANK
jgi:hypothetical protein